MRTSSSSSAAGVIVTMGDPSGIGPEVTVRALAGLGRRFLGACVVAGDARSLSRTLSLLRLRLPLTIVTPGRRLRGDALNVIDFANCPARGFAYGREDPRCGRAALDYIDGALRMLAAGEARGLVTAPVSKVAVARCGVPFAGHTEYLAAATGTKRFAMMLLGGNLKVTLVTRHIALKDVPAALSPEKICRAVELTHFALRTYFGIRSPRIGVAGLNPHAGDAGLFGTEEERIIRPALRRLARRFTRITGPRPPDIIFYEARHGAYDAVVAMYHDQGLIPLKTLYFDSGVNLTIGLPFVRTSPDHGTAFAIAGKGTAGDASMREAIRLAAKAARV